MFTNRNIDKNIIAVNATAMVGKWDNGRDNKESSGKNITIE